MSSAMPPGRPSRISTVGKPRLMPDRQRCSRTMRCAGSPSTSRGCRSCCTVRTTAERGRRKSPARGGASHNLKGGTPIGSGAPREDAIGGFRHRLRLGATSARSDAPPTPSGQSPSRHRNQGRPRALFESADSVPPITPPKGFAAEPPPFADGGFFLCTRRPILKFESYHAALSSLYVHV
jgi:hypothetical protein